MKIAFVASDTEKSQDSLQQLTARYGQHSPGDAEVIVALGGDGFMLQTLHRTMNTGKPVFGMRRGTVGFLMNDFAIDRLPERIAAARATVLHPLKMRAETTAGRVHEALAINEVSLLRQTRQSARIGIHVNGQPKIDELVCDGVLLSTAAGSTAYNLSAHGPVLPIGSEVLALTPISPFRPRRWRGAILPADAHVQFEVHDHEKRPVSATADNFEVRHVKSVSVAEDKNSRMTLLFDPHHNLEDRIINEQFAF
jgi:NAD+ kinase